MKGGIVAELSVLVPGYLTLRQAAQELGVSFGALKMYVWSHKIPTYRVGNVVVVNRSDLVGYNPRGRKLAETL